MKTDELREKYLAFFESKGCVRRPSDVLVPRWDPSVLFTPAGMNQFKDHFLGKVQARVHPGHHLPEVPADRRHRQRGPHGLSPHVLRDAGQFQLRRLLQARSDQLGLGVLDRQEMARPRPRPAVRLGLSGRRRGGRDLGQRHQAAAGPHRADGRGRQLLAGQRSQPGARRRLRAVQRDLLPPRSPEPRSKSGTWSSRSSTAWAIRPTTCGRCPARTSTPAWAWSGPPPCCKASTTNFHIDILRPIVEAAGEVCGVKYDPQSENGRRLRRITDHVRACTFAIHENVYPGPNKEKYVIKRLLRRAVLDGHQMGVHEPFLYKLVPTVAEVMKKPYPELSETIDARRPGDREGGEQFLRHDRRRAGPHRAAVQADEIRRPRDGLRCARRPRCTRRTAFRPSCSKRWPPSTTWPSIGTASARRWRSTASSRAAATQHGAVSSPSPLDALKKALHGTEFLGYETTDGRRRRWSASSPATSLSSRSTRSATSTPIVVVLDQTPFYGETGGQVGDTGEIVGDGFRFEVIDTQKEGGFMLHRRPSAQGQDRRRAPTSRRRSTSHAAEAFAGPIRPRTFCTTPCKSTWASTPSSRARRSTATGCGSTSPIPRPCRRDELAAIETEVNRTASPRPARSAGRGCRWPRPARPAP